jgi:copper homeostasis protein CutC
VKDWLANHLPESLLGIFATLVGWLAQRAINKVDAQEERIAALERDKVTKENIEELRESMNASITHAFARVETRTDEILLHLARRDQR